MQIFRIMQSKQTHAESFSSSSSKPPFQANMAQAIGDLATSLRNFVKSEIHLAKAEVKVTTRSLARDLSQIAFFSVLALAGILPMIAFCVIGLGNLLGGRYWLSSLIVALVFISVGGILAYRAFRKVKLQDLSFNQTRQVAEDELKQAQRKIREITEVTKNKRRMA